MTTITRASGVSNAAIRLRREEYSQVSRQRDTVTFSSQHLVDQLIDVFEECSQGHWDGEHAVPVASETLNIAKNLVESLPQRFRDPTVSGEPDGHVNLEWYVSPSRLLSVSVSPERKLYWAAIIGAEDPRGTCHYYGDAPKSLIYYLTRIFN